MSIHFCDVQTKWSMQFGQTLKLYLHKDWVDGVGCSERLGLKGMYPQARKCEATALILFTTCFLCLPSLFTLKSILGAPGWLSRLSVQLRLTSWSHGLWVRAPCSGSVLTAQSLEPASDFVSPPFPLMRAHSLSLSQKLKLKKILILKKKHFKCYMKLHDSPIFSTLPIYFI